MSQLVGVNDEVSVLLPLAEAVKYIKRESRIKGRSFFLHVRQEAVLLEDEDRYFNVLGNLQLPPGQIIAFIEDVYKRVDAKGSGVRIHRINKCVFVG